MSVLPCYRVNSMTNRGLLDNLARAGFQTYLGLDGTGLFPLIFERGGGIYIGQQIWVSRRCLI